MLSDFDSKENRLGSNLSWNPASFLIQSSTLVAPSHNWFKSLQMEERPSHGFLDHVLIYPDNSTLIHSVMSKKAPKFVFQAFYRRKSCIWNVLRDYNRMRLGELVSGIWITWDLCKAVFEWKFVALFFLFFRFFSPEISYLLATLAKRKTHVINGARSEVQKRQKVSRVSKAPWESMRRCKRWKTMVILGFTGISNVFSILEYFVLVALHTVWKLSSLMHTDRSSHSLHYVFVPVSIHHGYQFRRFQTAILHLHQPAHRHCHRHPHSMPLLIWMEP